ncbi:hypothetical protein ACNKHW_24125 [Shigella flexneri]
MNRHRDIQRHGVLKCGLGGDIARQCTIVLLLVITFGQLHNPLTSIKEQLLTARASPAANHYPAGQPSASVRQFIELAVNIPEQEPQVGRAERST